MIDIAAYIGKLVRTHELVIIPGLGGFLTNFHASNIHAFSNRIEPPGRHIAFNTLLKDNDGLLAHHLTKQTNLSYKDALNLVEIFAEFCKTELQNGNSISFQNLGILSLNKSKNIEFSPDLSINYADEYFGLPDIIAPQIQRNKDYEPVIQIHPQAKEKIRTIAPMLRRVAAIAIPLMILSIFVYFTRDQIKSAYQQSASVVSFQNNSQINSTSKPIKAHTLPISETKKTITDKDKTAKSNIETSIKPATISHPALNSGNNTEVICDEAPVSYQGNYHVICGAFSKKKLADRLINKLEKEGFKSYIAGQNSIGLYRVSLANFTDRSQAVKQLRWYQSNQNKNAWLLIEEL